LLSHQRVWAEINLDNIAYNTREIRKFIGQDTELMAIVKADGYGHGAIETSKVMLFNGATSLGVATCDEGISLRENNIFAEVLILSDTPKPKLIDVIENDLIQTIFHEETALALSELSKKYNKCAKINIKIDTGMGRLGFNVSEETINKIVSISELPNIEITGIYTHLAMSETHDKSFTHEQYGKFQYILSRLKEKGLTKVKKHICNSGAIINNKDIHMDAVRPGILLYGLPPSLEMKSITENTLDLKPAMSLKTRISYIKEVDKNVSIGYDRTFFTKRKTIVATLPIGYADGYSRALSNKGYVIVGDKYAPVIGRVCMDQMMIDVTEIKNIKGDEEVLLIGSKGNLEITADQVASLSGSISREVMCNIGKRVPRVYIKNNTMLKIINL